MNIVGHNPGTASANLNSTMQRFNTFNNDGSNDQAQKKSSFLYQVDQAVKNGQDNLYGQQSTRRGQGFENSGLQQLQSANNGQVMSSHSNNRLKLQRTLLDGSKVNNKIAKDLMNSQPRFSIQQMKGQQEQPPLNPEQFNRSPGNKQAFNNFQNSIRQNQNPQNEGTLFNHKQTLIDNKALKALNNSTIEPNNKNQQNNIGDDETRSVRSEFDYSTKKNFADIVKTNPNRNRGGLKEGMLNGLDQGISGGRGDRNDRGSLLSRRTGLSMRSGRQSELNKAQGRLNRTLDDMNPIMEEDLQHEDQQEGLHNFKETCNTCNLQLTEDEQSLNMRFISQANESGLDTSVFPLCLKCHFENIVKRGNLSNAEILQQQALLRQAQQYNTLNPPNLRNPFLLERASKKQFQNNFHQNSEEFKDLGTLHLERRNVDYYPQEELPFQDVRRSGMRLPGQLSTPQANSSINKKWKQNLGEKLNTKYGTEDNDTRQQRIEKAREKEQLKAFVGLKLQNENQRLLEMSKQLGGKSMLNNTLNGNSFNLGLGGKGLSTQRALSLSLKQPASGISQAGQSIAVSQTSNKFPSTTSRDAFNEEIYNTTKGVDRTNFKRNNVFGAYVNAMFNGGVFVNPALDQC